MLTRWRAWRRGRRLRRIIEEWEATVCPGLRIDDFRETA